HRRIDRKDHLTKTSRGRRRDWRDARTVLQYERRVDGVEGTLRKCLQERKWRRRERGGDPGHFDVDEAVARADGRLVVQPIDQTQSRSEIVLLQSTHGCGAWVLEQLRLQIEDGGLPVDFVRRKIQGVAQAWIDGEVIGNLPVVLDEVFLEAGALLNLQR